MTVTSSVTKTKSYLKQKHAHTHTHTISICRNDHTLQTRSLSSIIGVEVLEQGMNEAAASATSHDIPSQATKRNGGHAPTLQTSPNSIQRQRDPYAQCSSMTEIEKWPPTSTTLKVAAFFAKSSMLRSRLLDLRESKSPIQQAIMSREQQSRGLVPSCLQSVNLESFSGMIF